MTDGGFSAGPILAGAVAAGGVSRPLLLIFNEIGLVMAIMGALGGMTFAIALRAPWRDVPRPMLLGALFGFGTSALAPAILKTQLGVDVGAEAGGIEAMGASVFLLAAAQERVITIFVGKKGNPDNERDKLD